MSHPRTPTTLKKPAETEKRIYAKAAEVYDAWYEVLGWPERLALDQAMRNLTGLKEVNMGPKQAKYLIVVVLDSMNEGRIR